MLHMFRQLRLLCAAFVPAFILCGQAARAQLPQRFALERFQNASCRGKGRLQECDDKNPVMKQVLAARSRAVPVLISQFNETRRTKEPIEDFWNFTTSGDIAFIILTDLFTDRDGKSFTMPDAPNWNTIMAGCEENAEACWRKYVRKNGIKSLQHSWEAAWKAHRERVIWDIDSRCFRLKK